MATTKLILQVIAVVVLMLANLELALSGRAVGSMVIAIAALVMAL